jgi:hypothetical protein
LESQFLLEIVSDFSHESLERQLSDQQFSWFLVFPNFPQGHSPRSESVRLLHSTSSRSRLSGSLRSQMLSWSFSTSRFSCSLLCTSHLSSLFLIFFLVTTFSN